MVTYLCRSFQLQGTLSRVPLARNWSSDPLSGASPSSPYDPTGGKPTDPMRPEPKTNGLETDLIACAASTFQYVPHDPALRDVYAESFYLRGC